MSDTPKWTPGPWRVQICDDDALPRVFVTRHFGVAVPPKFYVAFLPDMKAGDSIADANLIASAPDLYAALLSAPDPWTPMQLAYGGKDADRYRAWFYGPRAEALRKAQG